MESTFRFQAALDPGTYRTRAGLANANDLSASRITQMLNLLRLPAEALRALRYAQRRTGHRLNERRPRPFVQLHPARIDLRTLPAGLGHLPESAQANSQ